MLVRCSVIVSDHDVKLGGHFQNLVGQCPMSDVRLLFPALDKSLFDSFSLNACNKISYLLM